MTTKSFQNDSQFSSLYVDECRNLLMYGPVGIFVSDQEGRVFTVTQRLVGMFGYASPEEMMSDVKDFGKKFYGDLGDSQEDKGLLQQAAEGLHFENHFIRKDGSSFWGLINVQAMRDETGAVNYYLGVC